MNTRSARATVMIAARSAAQAILSAAKEETNDRIRHHLIYTHERALHASEEIVSLLESAMDAKHNLANPQDAGDEPAA